MTLPCSVVRYNQSTNHKQEISGSNSFKTQLPIQLTGCAVEPVNRNQDASIRHWMTLRNWWSRRDDVACNHPLTLNEDGFPATATFQFKPMQRGRKPVASSAAISQLTTNKNYLEAMTNSLTARSSPLTAVKTRSADTGWRCTRLGFDQVCSFRLIVNSFFHKICC